MKLKQLHLVPYLRTELNGELSLGRTSHLYSQLQSPMHVQLGFRLDSLMYLQLQILKKNL